MLDELPPYFVNAVSKSIGNSDLSVVTATAPANLLVAVGRHELCHVCVVMSDLTRGLDRAGRAPCWGADSRGVTGAHDDCRTARPCP